MAFTDAEIAEIKRYLGYGNMTVGALPYFDVTAVFETVVASYTSDDGITYVRSTVLVNLRACDAALAPSQLTGRMKAVKVGPIELNVNELEKLAALRSWWIDRLSETLRIPRVDVPGKGACVEVC